MNRYLLSPLSLAAFCLGLPLFLIANAATADDEPFRPKPGKFPPLEKAHSYRGELVFVDHADCMANFVRECCNAKTVGGTTYGLPTTLATNR